MAERLIDVLDSSGAVIHTYPITLSDSAEAADETAYKFKALEACVRSLRLEPLVVGVGQKLFRDGRLNESQFFAALMKRTKLLEAVRGKAGTQGLGKVNIATVECNPQIHQRRKETYAAVATLEL